MNECSNCSPTRKPGSPSPGYVYFAMAFSIGVEMLNIRVRKRAARPVNLRSEYGDDGQA